MLIKIMFYLSTLDLPVQTERRDRRSRKSEEMETVLRQTRLAMKEGRQSDRNMVA